MHGGCNPSVTPPRRGVVTEGLLEVYLFKKISWYIDKAG